MSKSLNVFSKAGDGLKVSYNSQPTNDFLNYLNQYNTSNVDHTLNNLTSWASRASDNLQNMGGYTFQIDGSEDLKNNITNAMYQNYLSKLLPQYEAEQNDLQTRLLNQGLGVNTAAYQNAMNNLAASQNAALTDAISEAVNAGNEAYNNDIQNQIAIGNFQNNAAQNYINLLLSALENSLSSYDVAQNKYEAGNNLSAAQSKAQNQSVQNQLKAIKIAADTAKSLWS